MEVTIRPAVAADIPAMLSLWAESAAGAGPTDTSPALERLLSDQSGALLLAFDGARIVGTVIAAWDGWRGNIYRLVVAPGHRRRGIGRRLVLEAGRSSPPPVLSGSRCSSFPTTRTRTASGPACGTSAWRSIPTRRRATSGIPRCRQVAPPAIISGGTESSSIASGAWSKASTPRTCVRVLAMAGRCRPAWLTLVSGTAGR